MGRVIGTVRVGRSAVSAAAIVYLCLLQAFLWGAAQGAMATVDLDPLQVICSSSGATTANGGPDGPAERRMGCPLCALSRVAATALPAPDVPCAIIGRAEPATLVRAQPPQTVPSSLLRTRTAEARAPPTIS
ncbi:hypothetical protein AB7M35_002080 [Amorphus suaedae]